MQNTRSDHSHLPLMPLLALVLLLLQLPSSFAEEFTEELEEERFQVEYVIFKHKKSDTSELRFSDTRYRPDSFQQYNYLVSELTPLTPFHHQKLNLESATLATALKQLQRNRSIDVIDHAVWQQEIPADTTLDPFLISQTLPSVLASPSIYREPKLNGTLTIKRARYLHAEVDLFLADFIYFPMKDTLSWLLADSEKSLKMQWFLQPFTHEEYYLNKANASKVALNLVHMTQSRRLKYGEVHYLDHPALGVIVTISKLESTLNYVN